MPRQLAHPCSAPGCAALVEDGRFCPRHADRERAEHRDYRARRTDVEEQAFYRSAAWERLRSWVLAREPVCRECAARGEATTAEVVDHIVPIKADGDRLAVANVQPLCRACHNAKTGVEQAARRRGEASRA